jgi:MSHA biogenesis protein MshQ
MAKSRKPPTAWLGAIALLIAVASTLYAGSALAVFTKSPAVGGNTFSTDTMAAPASLTATVTNNSVVLNWTATATAYATGTQLLRSTTSGSGYSQIAQVTPRTTTTYTDTPGAGTYYYVVRSYFQNWQSATGNEASSAILGITFRSAASASAASGNLVVNVPSGTVASDVMVASIAVRPNTATITAPAGWTLQRRTDNANATASSLAVYYRVAGAGEPASYTWTLSANTGSAGGIQTFSNVDTSNPVDIENGQNTASALTHTSPTVTTTLTNTMLVTSYEFASSATWTPPGGMTETVDTASLAVPNAAGISLEANYATQAAAGATGTKTATASNDADVGNADTLALRPLITFRAASSAGAASGNLVINAPGGTVSSDVLVASIAVRPNTATITAPAGWTLIRRTDQATGAQNSLAVYYKVAGGSEPSSYTWTLSANTGSAGGIESFANVDTSAPVNIDNGQTTANGLTHAAPSVNTTVTSTMLVTSHEFSSSATWTPPGGMTEVVDAASQTVPNTLGISLEVNYVIQSATGATGTKTATASNDADAGCAHILALKPKP